MLAWRSKGGGETFDLFNIEAKFAYLQQVLRDRWMWFDLASLLLILGLLVVVLLSKRLTFHAISARQPCSCSPSTCCSHAWCSARLTRTCGWPRTSSRSP
jgi:hypothetical protein